MTAPTITITDEHRYGIPIVIRADGDGATKSLAEHCALDVSFSVGFA